MSAAPVLYAVTANRLRDGVPIYFAGNANWSTSVADAVTDYDGEALLAKSAAGTAPIDTIGRVAIEVTVTDGKVSPISLKERIRATGPTA
ncbi:MAG TPA: DUF2849 domain-containing protein [Alphaproteobacteria bacterium]|nr:DUF2849 domain-containing protein [Alphaproteobacteria bacterium]